MGDDHLEPPSFWRSPAGVTLLVALAVGGFYLLTEHGLHVFGLLPYLLVLACPVMHAFMHGGHGHRHGGSRHGASREKDDERRG